MTRLTSLVVAAALSAGCGDDGGSATPIDNLPSTLVNPIAVWAFSPTDVWFLDGTSTVHRYDGTAWSTLPTPSTGGLSCIYALSASDVWLCAGSEVLHYDGSTFTASNVTTPTGLDGLTALWATGINDVWVVGDDAIVAHYTGTTWQRTIVGSPFKSSIWGSSPTDVYTMSTFDLMHYDGNMWTEVEFDGFPAGGDGQVWGTSASDVWVMSDNDTVHHFNGSAWTATEVAYDLNAVWGAGPNQIWAGGTPGVIAHFDGSWSVITSQEIGSPYLRQMHAVHGSSASDVWVVGNQLGEGGSTGLIFHLP